MRIRKPRPLGVVRDFQGLPEGLAILTEANHVMPTARFRATLSDDSADMWREDYWEFFFALPDGKIYRLLFNTAGNKTFIGQDGQLVPAQDIKSFNRWPINKSGGTAIKLLVPWKYFDLPKRPPQETVWEMQVGREFNTSRQIFVWGPAWNSFHERDKWGRLVFGEATPSAEKTEQPKPELWVNAPSSRFVISGHELNFYGEAANPSPKDSA